MSLDPATLEEIEICCDLERHVYYAGHTHPAVVEALRESHWFDLTEWTTSGPGAGPLEECRKIAVLSGGVGGARFLRGLVEVVEPSAVTVIGNVGDDVEVLGLHVSPDLDSILYALAGVADDERGWGRADETWQAMEVVAGLGGEAWFQLGDRDLGLHLVRTQALRGGEPLSAVTRSLAAALGVEVTLLPATDDALRTWIDTPAGSFPFQEWFVARQHRDEVDRVRFDGEATATPAPGVLDALDGAELIVIAPSNPFISIWPILAVAEIRAALERRRVRASRSARSSAAVR